MKVKIDISPQYDKEIIIRSFVEDEEIKAIVESLKNIEKHFTQITGYIDETTYSIELDKIIFFETSERRVYAHKINKSFLIRHRLYELEEKLPDNFLRVSKSTILNVNEISSLSRSVTGNLVQFKDTYKKIYVSRRFLKELKNKLNQRRF